MKTAYVNARVWTGEDGPLREAFTVEDGRFRRVGTTEEIRAELGAGDEVVDLGGSFVCPGFNDSHMHLLGLGSVLRTAQLGAHTGSLAEILDYLRTYLAAHRPGEGQWLLGRGWNQDLFADVRRMPDRHDLDSVSRDVPIMLTRACGHCCVLNSRALACAGIGPDTAVSGGAVGMADGVPDGRLYDNAIELATRVLPAPGPEDIRDMLRAACREMNRFGITSVQTDDYQVFPGVPWETINGVFREMAAGGELTVRVCEQAQFPDPDDLLRFIDAGCVTGAGDAMFRIGPYKIVADGSLGSRTAYLSRPYADDPSTRGLTLYAPERLGEMMYIAHAHGMQLAVHAIGDACLDLALDAVERAMRDHPRRDCRHGVVHCQISRPDQLARIRDLNMHVYAQSVFLNYDNHIVAKRAGEELASSSYSWKTLMRGGVSVSNGSDCPVETPDVMTGIECAVTRTSLDGTGPYLPDQAFTVREALESYTVRGAETSFEENVKGRIAPGCLADFTALSDDPFTVAPRGLHRIRATGCWLGGRRVYPV